MSTITTGSTNVAIGINATNDTYNGFSFATPNNPYSQILFKCGNDEYISKGYYLVSTTLKAIIDEYPTRVENDTGFNILRNSDMRYIIFTKVKSQIEYIRDELNKIFNEIGIGDSKFHEITKNVIGMAGLSQDEIFDKLRKFPNSAKALVVLFKSNAYPGIEISIGDTIHAKEIFGLLLNTTNDSIGLTRKAIRNCWGKMTNDEALSVQQQIKDLIISCAKDLASEGGDAIISNIRFLKEFILEVPKK